MQRERVSCIVAVYNGERYLGEAIDSILAQTLRPMEIIVVDDGSTDGTASVAHRYGEQIRYVWQPNGGPAAARNFGLSLIQGELVSFLDADDLWQADKLARQLARFHARPELDLCVTHVRNFWIPELRDEALQFAYHRHSQPVPGYVVSTLLARRQLFADVGTFDTSWRHVHDTEWFWRAAERGAVVELMPDVLAHRRLHHTNRSRVSAAKSRHEYTQFLKMTIDHRRRQSTTADTREARK